MKTISRYIMTLALLITAAASAWAQTETLLTTITATGQTTYSESTAGVVTVSHDNDYFDNTFGWLWYEHAGSVTVEAKDGYTITRCVFSQPYKTPFTVSTAPFKVDFIETSDPDTPELKQYLCQGYMDGVSSIEVYGYAAPASEPTIDVTTNAASEQDLFTEAWFTMPTSDVTVSYMLVRDMQDKTNPVAFTGLPSSGNIVVKKGDNGKYQPAETLNLQLIDPLAAAEAQNIIAADGITVKVLVGDGGTPIEYDQDNPITFEDFLADMKPGYYWIKAEPTDENSPYDGTVYSSEFTVVEQYDLTVKPANDFSKKGLDAVTVGTESITIDANTGEAAKTGIAPETEVKIKAKRGYVIDKVEAKKKAAPAKPEYADNAEELPANTKLYMRTDLVYNGDWIWNPTYTAEQAQAVANYYAAITGTKCAVIYGHGSGTDIYYVTSDNGVNETIYRNNDLTEKFPGYKVYLLK